MKHENIGHQTELSSLNQLLLWGPLYTTEKRKQGGYERKWIELLLCIL